MYRFLMTPRWLGINLFAVIAVPVCILMGTWQLGRFEDRVDTHRKAEQRPAATAADAVPVTDVLGDAGPGKAPKAMGPDDVGRAVSATGSYDAAHQLLVPGRTLGGRNGYYVLTMLRTGSGRALPVVRGWHPGEPRAGATGAPKPPGGEVRVLGSLQAAESSGSEGVSASGGLPSGQIGVISASSLVNVLPYSVHDAWVTLARADAGLETVPPTAQQGGGLDLKAFQNLGYTGEWFVFAGFVVFMWYRLFRRDAELERDMALGLAPAPDQSPDQAPTPAPATPAPAAGDPSEKPEPTTSR